MRGQQDPTGQLCCPTIIGCSKVFPTPHHARSASATENKQIPHQLYVNLVLLSLYTSTITILLRYTRSQCQPSNLPVYA